MTGALLTESVLTRFCPVYLLLRIIWELERAMPATFFNETKVAAG